MLSDAVVVVAFNNHLDWPADYNLQTCYALAAHGNVVFAMLWADAKSIRTIILDFFHGRVFRPFFRKRKAIFIQPIHFLPFSRFQSIKTVNFLINALLVRLLIVLRYPASLRVLWIFSPEFSFIPQFFGSSYSVLYDCVDYFVSADTDLHRRFQIQEESLFTRAHLMVVNSQALFERYKDKHPNLIVVPQGFALDQFSSRHKISSLRLPFPSQKPIIGYVGGMNYRLDYNLLNELIARCSNFTFVFIGPRQFSTEDAQTGIVEYFHHLLTRANVYWIDVQPREKISILIHSFDAALIPYDVSLEFNRFCFPMKLLEYFYLGRPVVSTPIQELISLQPLLRIGKNASEFHSHIQEILHRGWPASIRKRQLQLAVNNSWEKRVKKITSAIARTYF